MKSPLAFLLCLCLLGMLISCSGRNETGQFSEDIVYRTVGDDWRNYYVSVVPNGQIQGLIVLLPSFGAPPEKFLYEIRLDSLAVASGLVMLAPSPQGRETHYLDDASIDTLHLMIQEASRRYNLAGKKFVIGGFSIGGTGALRYAERLLEGGWEQDLSLAGAFAVDAPLDFERLWLCFEKEMQQTSSQEADYFLRVLARSLGGSPQDYKPNYAKGSPFLASEENGGRAPLLKDLPLRFYVEPDTAWWKANGWLEYKYQNAQDMDLLVKQLRSLGSEQVELLKTSDKGYRKNGKRHPHSWSIVDERELLDWILKTIHEH